MKQKTTAVLLLIFLILTGCNRSQGGGAGARAAANPGGTADNAVVINRIISTAPSNTEIIIGLGLGNRIIAADKYSMLIPGLPPDIAEIDFFYPDPEAIIGLVPDIIITSEHNVYGAGDDPFRLLKEMGIAVVYLPTSNSIADIYRDIETIAAALDAAEKGQELIQNMNGQINSITAIGSSITVKKSVYFEISPAPNMVSMGRETFLNEMIELIGAQNVFADKTGWIAPGAEAVLERNPDIILTNVNFIDNPIGEIKKRDGFHTIKAVRDNAVYTIDTDSSSRPSQHIILALKQMVHAVYPNYYD
ncbi:ABC transporter substrate-binding protein [Spirochaetia bacterium]|nr:ABC transporter substrate-binding protein [Spirochaetia bacterium]